MRDALVSYLVVDDSNSESGEWFHGSLQFPEDWTHHFSRQLGMGSSDGYGIHETLLFVVVAVNKMIETWPPTVDQPTSQALAHEATKHLGPMELYGTLLAGPPSWRNAKLPADCKIDGLANRIRSCWNDFSRPS